MQTFEKEKSDENVAECISGHFHWDYNQVPTPLQTLSKAKIIKSSFFAHISETIDKTRAKCKKITFPGTPKTEGLGDCSPLKFWS